MSTNSSSTDVHYETQTVTFMQANNATPPGTTGGFASSMTIPLPTSIDYSNSEVALQSFFCYYSWFNITANFQNNTLYYVLPTQAGTSFPNSGSPNFNPTSPLAVFTNSANSSVIGDGLYGVLDLNNALTYTLQLNGHYYVDSNGNYHYPITFAVNPSAYCVTITINPIYTIANIPSGWVAGTSSTGSTPFGAGGINYTVNTCASLYIPATGAPAGTFNSGQSSMSKVLGFSPSQGYPSLTSNPNTLISALAGLAQLQYNSQFAPQVGVINSINVCSNLVNASAITPVASSVIYNFSPTVGSGQQIQEKPYSLLWLPITPAKYNLIQIYLQTDAFQQLRVFDPAMSCTLLIRKRILPTRKQALIQQSLSAGLGTSAQSNKRARPDDGSSLGSAFAPQTGNGLLGLTSLPGLF